MIGTGYVGLVSGACFSEFGLTVACVDQDAAKIARLQDGEVPIFEPGLGALVAANMAAGRLNFTTDLAATVAGAEAVFIAVGTPSRRGDGHADLSYVNAAAEAVGRALSDYAVVVTKSTVPVGTGRKVAQILRRTRPPGGFDVASNPEFLREGSAIADFMRPDRVVIGTEGERAQAVLRQLYRPLYLIETPIVFTGIETAELIKYAANSFLATKITFINEIAAADGHHPPAALQRQHQAAAGALPDVGNRPHGFPIGRGVVRDREDCRGIADINTDDGFLGHRLSDGFEQAERRTASSGGINDQIGGQRLALSVGVLKADRDDRRAIRRGYEAAHAATRSQGDVSVSFYAPTHHELDQWAGHRMSNKAEIALRERIVAWHLDATIEGDTKRHRPGASEILFEAGKQLVERALAACQQRMNVPGLWRPGPVNGV